MFFQSTFLEGARRYLKNQKEIRNPPASAAPTRNRPTPEKGLRRRMNNELNFPPNFERLVLGCIDADFCK